MNISRRGFLGSVIGTLAVSQLPFVAEAVTPFSASSGLNNFRLSAFSSDFNGDEEEFWMPSVIGIIDVEKNKISWAGETIVLNMPVMLHGCKLYAPNGELVSKTYFWHSGLYLSPGNQLKTIFHIDFEQEKFDLTNWQAWVPVVQKHVTHMG